MMSSVGDDAQLHKCAIMVTPFQDWNVTTLKNFAGQR